MLTIRPVDLPPILPLPDAKHELESQMGQTSVGKEGVTHTCKEGTTVASLHGHGMSERFAIDSCALDSGRQFPKHHGTHPYHHTPPKLDFPHFDGENSKAWQLKCENYFRVCSVHPEFMISVATMYFVGGALLWLQASRALSRYESWESFAEAVCNRFGREEFQQLVRQFGRFRQTGTIAEYAEKFNELMHNLLAHHSSWNPIFFVTQFVDGLCGDIRSAVVLHRPPDLDTAVALACLQEEVLETTRRDPRRGDFASGARVGIRTALPLPLPPGKGIPGIGNQPDERRGSDGMRIAVMDDRLGALRAYQRVKGLCHTCGERWSQEHKCAPTVQLHVVEELWEMVDEEDWTSQKREDEASVLEADLMSISKEAVQGSEHLRTFRLLSTVQNQAVVMLVDSGSSHSFISEDFSRSLMGERQSKQPVQVRVANGGLLASGMEFPMCQWEVRGHTFYTTFRVLPLQSYAIILGMDWLEQHSPMNIHWWKKVMSFCYEGHNICLQGIKPIVSHFCLVWERKQEVTSGRPNEDQLLTLEATSKTEEEIPPSIVQLLQDFNHLFEEPHGLPPCRAFDHSIPLMSGVKPINLRPYRYSPTQKMRSKGK